MVLRSSPPASAGRNRPDSLRVVPAAARARPLRMSAISRPERARARARAPSRKHLEDKAIRACRAAALGLAPRLRCGEGEGTKRASRSTTQQSPREHAMMFAFALAIIGVVVLAAMNRAAAHAA